MAERIPDREPASTPRPVRSVDVADGRLNDPLFRRYMTVADLVSHGRMTPADAASDLVRTADRLGRTRLDVGKYVPQLHRAAPTTTVPTPEPWEPDQAA